MTGQDAKKASRSDNCLHTDVRILACNPTTSEKGNQIINLVSTSLSRAFGLAESPFPYILTHKTEIPLVCLFWSPGWAKLASHTSACLMFLLLWPKFSRWIIYPVWIFINAVEMTYQKYLISPISLYSSWPFISYRLTQPCTDSPIL